MITLPEHTTSPWSPPRNPIRRISGLERVFNILGDKFMSARLQRDRGVQGVLNEAIPSGSRSVALDPFPRASGLGWRRPLHRPRHSTLGLTIIGTACSGGL